MMLKSQATDRHLNSSSSAKGMSMQGFRRTHGDSVGMLTKDLFDGARFNFIIERCRAAVSVNIANLLRSHLCFLQGELHGPCCWVALRMWGSHVVGIVGESVAEDFAKNRGAALHSVL